MKKLITSIMVVATFLSGSELLAQESPQFKVVKVEIIPNSVKDAAGAFFRKQPILEVAPTSGKEDKRIKMGKYRSYRFIATIKTSGVKKLDSCLVVTQCIRNGKTVILGKTRIALEGSSTKYACYHVYPSSAESGDCIIRTIVEVDGESQPQEFKATIR